MDTNTRKAYIDKVVDLDKRSAKPLHKATVILRRVFEELFSGDKALRKDLKNFLQKNLFKKNVKHKKNYEFDNLFKEKQKLISEYIDKNRADNKSMPCVIFFGYPDFRTSGGGQRSWQMAKSFFRTGYHVEYYHEGTLQKDDVNWPAQIAFPLYYTDIDTIFRNIPEDATIIFEAPSYKYADILRKAHEKGIYTIYEHIDNWETSLGSGFFEPELFKEFLNTCNCIVATCKGLVDLIAKYTDRQVLYSPNAVDNHLYKKEVDYDRPSDLVCGRKTLLYFGALTGEWHNWEIVRKTALECPDCTLNLIGRGIPEAFKSEKPHNIHLLGPKKQTELPAYLANCDFALLPFDTGEISRYVSPLKIFEYLALQVPVLATPLDDIIGYPNTVISNDYKEWVKTINSDFKATDTTAFTENNCWDARCRQLIEYKEKYFSESKKE